MSENLALISDLIFRSRIDLAARAVGATFATVTDEQELARRLAKESVRMVMVDMELPSGQAIAAIRTACAGGAERVVAFYPHVQTELAEQAMAAGATLVLPRSAFVAQLPELLGGDH